ncbi:MAG TPA: DnaJ domain-containing protein [Candidatus Limnocylindrales bacterium]|nr:DnaJ domain-containing protein [Candidatus Limnocylindrales bacterium]
MDPYRVLGLPPDASQAEVKRAYRRLAKELHPDAAGESALPRFLELQDAYELLTGTRVRTVRAPGSPASAARGSGPGGAPAGAEGFREPWRADPARARAAREQARTRRPWPGGQPSWTTGSGSASGGPARPAGEARRRRPPAGTADSVGASGAASANQPGAAHDGSPGSRSERRRRASRKATLGSTSYDEARDAADRSWSGASWYGPTTGEYWIVNPREYADPRKHGPGYSSRGRLEQDPTGSDPEPRPSAAPSPEVPSEPRRAEPAAASPFATRHVDPTTTPTPVAATAPAEPWPGAPWRRVGLTLLAWPPLGLAAAAAIGQATGCSTYSTACDSADRLLPWLAQAVLLALLLASPWLARLLAGGSIGALVALVPGVGIITALGGAQSADGPPVLAGWLALSWLAGVFVAGRRAFAGVDERPSSAG